MSAHVLVRTNEKGVPFIGRCIKCGAENLRGADANKPCANVKGMPHEVATLKAIMGNTNDD